MLHINMCLFSFIYLPSVSCILYKAFKYIYNIYINIQYNLLYYKKITTSVVLNVYLSSAHTHFSFWPICTIIICNLATKRLYGKKGLLQT